MSGKEGNINQIRRLSTIVQAVVVEAEWKAWECPYTKNEDTVALRKFREQIKVELEAKDGEIENFLLVYMMDEMDLGYNRRALTQMFNKIPDVSFRSNVACAAAIWGAVVAVQLVGAPRSVASAAGLGAVSALLLGALGTAKKMQQWRRSARSAAVVALLAAMSGASAAGSVAACRTPQYAVLSWVLVASSAVAFLKLQFLLKLGTLAAMLAFFLGLVAGGPLLVGEQACLDTGPRLTSVVQKHPGIATTTNLYSPSAVLLCRSVLFPAGEWLPAGLVDGLTRGVQMETTARLDLLWKNQAETDLRDMRDLRTHNTQLLHNILPEHVARYFLERTVPGE
ncbi:acy-4, partial [Cordylochernes scorpioides]